MGRTHASRRPDTRSAARPCLNLRSRLGLGIGPERRRRDGVRPARRTRAQGAPRLRAACRTSCGCRRDPGGRDTSCCVALRRRCLGPLDGFAHRRHRLSRDRRRGRRRTGGRLRTRGQQGQGIDVTPRIVRPADPELDVRLLALGRKSDRPDGLALRDTVADGHGDRAEMCEGHRPSVVRADRERLAVRGQRAREGHRAGGRCEHGRTGGSGDVDAAVTGRRVGAAPVVEAADHLTGRRPRPGASLRRRGKGQKEEDGCQS
jgi:hypothetical protein